MPTVRDFFLANFDPPVSYTCNFSKTSPTQVFLVLAVANASFCVHLQNKIGHHALHYTQLIQVLFLQNIKGSKTSVIMFLGRHFEIVSIILILRERLVYFMKYYVC